jgi:hypothetical protein
MPVVTLVPMVSTLSALRPLKPPVGTPGSSSPSGGAMLNGGAAYYAAPYYRCRGLLCPAVYVSAPRPKLALFCNLRSSGNHRSLSPRLNVQWRGKSESLSGLTLFLVPLS